MSAPHSHIFSHSFSTTWRKALVSLPRLVPNHALYLTSPDGPHPFVVKVPSFHPRNHDIPCHVFLYVPPPSLAGHSISTAATPATATVTTETATTTTTTTTTAASSSTSNTEEQHVLRLPVLIDFHGGSFILGTPQEQAPFCAQMARELGTSDPGGGCVVISVDYRLGPYAQYPAANEDAEDILRAVLEPSTLPGKIILDAVRQKVRRQLDRDDQVHLDPSRVALSGFSSGGNLALGLAISVANDPTIHRDWPSVIPPDFPRGIPLLLFYPSLDSRLLPDERPRPPGLDPPTGFFSRLQIESELMPKYMPVSQRGHPRASPGLAPLEGLHPRARIMLVLPELDSLSEQSMAWIEKLAQEGRSADLDVVQVPGVMHGWTQFPDSWLKSDDERAKKAMVFDTARRFVQQVWNSGTFGAGSSSSSGGGGGGGDNVLLHSSRNQESA